MVEAQRKRLAVLAGFHKQIADADRPDPASKDPIIEQAVMWREAREAANMADDADEAGGSLALTEHALEEVVERLKADGGTRKAFVDVAYGRATPLLHHVSDWLREGGVKGAFEARTKLQHERTLTELQGWMVRAKLPATLEAVDRRLAGRFVTDCLARSDRQPKTLARVVSSCRSYWRFLLLKGIVPGEKNPWDGQAPPKGSSKGTADESERPFTDAEVRRLLGGPADAELSDLMPMAALSGMRIEEIYRLEVRDCVDGRFNIRRSKTKAGQRHVPIHPALTALVARRSEGKAPRAFLFHEAGDLKEGRERSMAVSKRFGHYRKRDGVGVDEVAEGKRRSLVNFHSFRRWFVTAAVRAGQPERVVGQIVGHKAQGMTMGVYYGGDLLEQLRACVEAVELPVDAP